MQGTSQPSNPQDVDGPSEPDNQHQPMPSGNVTAPSGTVTSQPTPMSHGPAGPNVAYPTFPTAPNRSNHCLVLEEEHSMSATLGNMNFQCTRLTHRNAETGAIQGIVSKLRDKHYCALIIHIPTKKRDIKEKRYQAHLKVLVSWSKHAHESSIPILWIGPFGKVWQEFCIREMVEQLRLQTAYYNFCKLKLSCKPLEGNEASASCFTTVSNFKPKGARCNCNQNIKHTL